MSARKKDSVEQPRSGYFYESARPFTSLIFILPMLLAYEGGILALGPQAVHNGAATWLQRVLSVVGFGNYILLIILNIILTKVSKR